MEMKSRELVKKFEEKEYLKGLKSSTVKYKIAGIEKLLKKTGKNVSEITGRDILSYLDNKSITSKLFNKRLSRIKHFFEYLLQQGEILKDPSISIGFVRVSRGEHLGVFTEGEIRRIFQSIPDDILGRRDRAMLEVFYSTGIRLGELVALNVDDVDFRNSEIFIREGKGCKERIVPVGSRALNALDGYLSVRHDFIKPCTERDALFLSIRGRRICTVAVETRIRKWKEKSGVSSRGTAHAFRHSFASHMLARGAPIHMIRRILGHEHLSTTERYTHILRENQQAIHSQSHPKAKEEE